MKKLVAIFIIIIVLSGFSFILALQSSQIAMAGQIGGDMPGCLEHCLSRAAPFFQQNTIVPLVLLLLTFTVLDVILLVYTRSQALGYCPQIIFNPFYLFKTVVLRE